LRKPHERLPRLLLRLLLVGLGCCLIPQLGPGQLPIVENRAPIRLGPPREPEKALPQVLEFEPIKAAISQTLELPPPLPLPPPAMGVHEPIPGILPKICTVLGVALPTTPPFSPEPPLWEIELLPEPILPSPVTPEMQAENDPFERPMFGSAVGLDLPAYTDAVERRTLVYWTNDPVQFVSVERPTPKLAVVPLDTPVFGSSMIPLAENPSLDPDPASAPPFLQVESEATRRARMQPPTRERSYMDRLGSPDGTLRLVAHFPQAYAAYQPLPVRRSVPQHRAQGVLHWAFSSALSVRASLAETFHYFD
jgi:hypothetical protein